MPAIAETGQAKTQEPSKTNSTPVPVTGADLKRAARGTDKGSIRYALSNIEISPTGLAATNGRILIAINAPGQDFTGYVEAKDIKAIANASEMSVNGSVQFVSTNQGAKTSTTVPHKTAKDINFPKWPKILPDAENLAPIGTFGIPELKAILTALAIDIHQTVTIFARTDNPKAQILLANSSGDLGVVMPVVEKMNRDSQPLAHFPKAIYEAHGKSTETAKAIGDKPE